MTLRFLGVLLRLNKMPKRFTLFGNILKKGDSVYSNPKSNYEHFVACWYQCQYFECKQQIEALFLPL